jgi:hypothetical protein
MAKRTENYCSCGQPFSLCQGPADHDRNLRAVEARQALEAQRALEEEQREAAEPTLAKSLLEGERSMRLTEYRNLAGRMVVEACELAKKADAGRISTHDGINLSRLAVDVAALAAVLESLGRCIDSAK